MNSEYAINVRGLNKYFGSRHIVRDVSLAVRQGRITGFLGPNGAGKTTCLRLLCGLLTPDSGEGEVLGYDFRTQSAAIKRQTGYMTQKFSLYDDLTIEENLLFMARVHELDQRPLRIRRALERLALTDRAGQLAGALSGGWKQRLALAVTILHEPRLLLLDEPTAGVDPSARREFWNTIHELAEQGLTVLVSTHYMDEAERCHDIGYIVDGTLIVRGTPETIIRESGLITFAVTGEHAPVLGKALETRPGVLSATLFGARLHITGTDRAVFETLRHEHSEGYVWQETAPTLEDVFIKLMNRNTGGTL